MAKEWREVRLSDVADVDRESLGSATDPSLEFAYISLANVEAGRIVDPLKRLRYSQAPTRARRVLRCGDILVSTVRPNLLGFARVDAGHQRCIASTGFAAISPGGDSCTASTCFSTCFPGICGHNFNLLWSDPTIQPSTRRTC